MLRRLAAFVFLLSITGQVYAGVCGCLGGESQDQHSCCKREKVDRNVMSRKGCCETDCMVQQSSKLAQDRTASILRIELPTADEPVSTTPRMRFRPVAIVALRPTASITDQRLKFPRPPDLYLYHRAFLI
jgi:hypothetical protein